MTDADFNPGEGAFDLIIGSDIIFFKEASFLLAKSISYLLNKENPDAKAIIANDVLRYNNQEDDFEAQLPIYGLEVIYREQLTDKHTTHKLLIIRHVKK